MSKLRANNRSNDFAHESHNLMVGVATASPDETIDGKQGSMRLGSYVLRHRLAHGGMAEVYLAQKIGDEGFTKWVAIKAILEHLARDDRFVRMFLAEARLAARIDHPNVCAVFDFGQSRGTYFIAMEYLHGQPLSALMQRAVRQRGVPVKLAARIVADAARGLHAAHELRREDGSLAEVIHRDISPQNIFVLYSGATKVVDFGIARSNDAISDKTATGELKGKISYMAPEQIRGGALDRRADIWALGVVLWELLTGQRLFKRDNDMATGFAVLDAPIPPPSTMRPGLPPSFDQIVLRALARDRNDRYAQVLDLARDLEAALANFGVTAGQEEVSEFVTDLFAKEHDERQKLLRQLSASKVLEVASIASLDGEETLLTPSDQSEISAMATKVPAPITNAELQPAHVMAPVARPLTAAAEPTLTATSSAARAGRDRRWALLALIAAPLLSIVAAVVVVRTLVQPTTTIEHRVIAQQPPAITPDSGIALAPPTITPPATPPTRVASAGTRANNIDSATTTVMTTRRGPRPGHATLLSSPPSDVYLGARRLGRTPIASVDLPPGRHSLRFVAPGGLPPQQIDVEIRSGGTTVRRVRWRELD